MATTDPTEQKVLDFIEASTLPLHKGRLLVAVSGGADSTALLLMLHSLRGQQLIESQLMCVHFDHQLRGETTSKAEQEQVCAFADRLKIPCVVESLPVRKYAETQKQSIETAARELRIERLTALANRSTCQAVATGHHMNDNAETLVFRLLRGTGMPGLVGIRPMIPLAPELPFIRPLLCLTRDEIIEYLKQREVKWVEDPSNRDCGFRRNYIRHRLLPRLQAESRINLAEALSSLAKHARGLQRRVDELLEHHWGSWVQEEDTYVHLHRDLFNDQPELVQVAAVSRCLKLLGCGLRNIDRPHLHHLCVMGRTGHGNHDLPAIYSAEGMPSGLRLVRVTRDEKESPLPEPDQVPVPGTTRWGPYQITSSIIATDADAQQAFFESKSSHIEWLDADALTGDLVIRAAQPGDRFVPLGASSAKKVARFLMDAKVDAQQRKQTFVVTDRQRIVWVVPVRLSDEVKVTASTRRVVQLEVRDARFYF